MHTVVYDGSFEGWLTTVFDVYEYKLEDVMIVRDELHQPCLVGNTHIVHTDEQKATRVYKGLQLKLSTRSLHNLYRCFLSEEKQIENTMLAYMRYVFAKKYSVENDYSNPAVLAISQTAKKVHRESHRMEAFVRFQLAKDGLYYSIVSPDFNVLPLVQKHFARRYADQRWLIYDSARKYGIYYNLQQVEMVNLLFTEDSQNTRAICDEKEELYQRLWQQYFSSVNIAARKNMKLHIQHMPKRYWKYLTEKRPL